MPGPVLPLLSAVGFLAAAIVAPWVIHPAEVGVTVGSASAFAAIVMAAQAWDARPITRKRRT